MTPTETALWILAITYGCGTLVYSVWLLLPPRWKRRLAKWRDEW